MIRLVGAALLTAGGAALGFGAVRHLERRVRDLNLLSVGLAVMRRELDHRMTALPELLALAAKETKHEVSDFFRLCSVGASHLNGRAFRDIWKQGLELVHLHMEAEDLAVVERLGSVLGRYDGENQRQALDEARDRLDEQRKLASEQRNRLGKVYGTLGLTAGAFLVILLI